VEWLAGHRQAVSSHQSGLSNALFLDWLLYVQKLERDIKELKSLFERYLAAADKRPVGNKPDNTQKAPENTQKSSAPIREEENNAKRRRADASEFIPTWRAGNVAEDRPIQSASCKGKTANPKVEVHCFKADRGEAQQMHSRRVTEVTGIHTSEPEREQNPLSDFASFNAEEVNRKHIMKEQVRAVLLYLKASGCDVAALKQVQWGENLQGMAATVLAEMESDGKKEKKDIIDLDTSPTVQPEEGQPPIFPPEPTHFGIDEKVVLHGQVTRPDLNGRAGMVLERPGKEGRYPVILLPVGGYDVKTSELIRAKPENLRRPTPYELVVYFKEFWKERFA